MKTSRACTDMWSYENDAFKCSKTAKNTNSMCITCIIIPGFMERAFFSKPIHGGEARDLK